MGMNITGFCLFRMIQTDDFLYHAKDIKIQIMIYKEKNRILKQDDEV